MKKLLVICLFLLLLISFLNLLKTILLNVYLDFNVYYSSASSAFLHGNPYGESTGGFLYPPFCLLLFYPFLLFPIIIAGKLWTLVSIICLLTAIWLMIKMYKETNLIVILLIGISVFNYFPVKYTLGMGQINNLILFLIASALYTTYKKKEKAAGIFYGISLMIKYFPVLLLPYLIIKMQWRVLAGIGLTLLGLSLLGMVFFGININAYYLFHVLPSLSMAAHGAYYYNQALSGFLQRDFASIPYNQLNILRYCISILLLGSTLWLINKRKTKITNANLEISLIIILSLLLNSFSWQHHFVLLLVPLLVTFFIIKQQKRSWKYYLILIICYLLTATNVKNPTELPIILQSHVFYGTVILWFFDMYLLYQLPTKYEKNKTK